MFFNGDYSESLNGFANWCHKEKKNGISTVVTDTAMQVKHMSEVIMCFPRPLNQGSEAAQFWRTGDAARYGNELTEFLHLKIILNRHGENERGQ